MSGHTPGPWKFGEYKNIYAYDQGPLGRSRVVALAPAVELAGGRDEQRANARLIAAAPDLLEALTEYFEPSGSGPQWRDKALAATAKATGGKA